MFKKLPPLFPVKKQMEVKQCHIGRFTTAAHWDKTIDMHTRCEVNPDSLEMENCHIAPKGFRATVWAGRV